MRVKLKDYNTPLGVPRDASDDNTKKPFRRLARQYHPDVAKDKKAAEEKFKEINEANEVLSDPQKRKKYDQLGARWKEGAGFQPPPGWQQRAGQRPAGTEDFEFHFDGTGFSDFFEQFFGRGSRSGFGFGSNGMAGEEFAQERRPARGSDIEGDILVTLDEVVNGSVRAISLQSTNPRTGQTETQTFKVRI